MTPHLLWFRQDLRLSDQAAYAAAAAAGPIIPVYILDEEGPGDWAMGAAQRWWLHHSLARLSGALADKGLRLILRRGDSVAELKRLTDETGATTIHALRHYEPWWRAAEDKIAGLSDLRLYDGNYLVPPGRVTSNAGTPYRIYTPFYRALVAHLPPPEPGRAPAQVEAPKNWPRSDRLEDWDLRPTRPDWAGGFAEAWTPGTVGARSRLRAFASHAGEYARRRDLPSEEGTSRLSPHLHFGEVSPAMVWHGLDGADAAKFRKELAWRDFAANVLLDQPRLGEADGRKGYQVRWRSGAAAEADFAAWTRGRTGYPIVDAGMRQLWTTGWMHNRVRMIAASFLVKHLLIDWRRGARWFWDTLVDADYGNNSLNWQWVAGSGADSSPFARIMAPLVQSEKFDAAGYIRQWVPELSGLSDSAIHDPEDAACDYPAKRIGHREARERALAAYRS